VHGHRPGRDLGARLNNHGGGGEGGSGEREREGEGVIGGEKLV